MSNFKSGQEAPSQASHDNIDETNFDVVIIGSGPGGYSTALRSAQLGAHVAIVERDAVVGGTCLNRGCIPTKALMTATSSITQSIHAKELGIRSNFEGIDFDKLNAFRQASVDNMTSGLSELLSQRKVEIFRGRAEIQQAGEVCVSSPDGTKQHLKARNIVIATGAKPTPLPGIAFSDNVLDSDHALQLPEFPQKPVIIGAGAVAVEFASIWQAAGSQVTLIIRKDRVLSQWDRRAGVTLTRELKKQGVRIISDSQCTGIEGQTGQLNVSYTSANSESNIHESQSIQADRVLVAIGRTPNTDAEWFNHVGLRMDEHGFIVTDPWGKTNVTGIWALGDITAGYHFAHRAFEQGIVAAESIAGLNPSPVNESTIPQVVFSTPPAACVGYTRQQALMQEHLTQIEEVAYPMLANARMRMSGTGGSLSIVTACEKENPSQRIVVGVHIVAPEAAELIAEAEQIVGNRIPLSQAARLIHPHPTFSETLGETLLKADGRPLHMR